MSTSTLTPPDRTIDQRLTALRHANDTRFKRAAMKIRLKAGEENLVSLIAQPPPYASTMAVFDLLKATPKIGKVKATRLLIDCSVAPSKTLGGLTSRQRAMLILTIRDRWPAVA